MVHKMESFEGFAKIPRLSRNMIITEKIDGTNAQILITDTYDIYAGSRNRWISAEDDNYGFARWVWDHADELKDGLGIGRHFGEWWGSGVNRGYGLLNGEKRFSLFNRGRWNEENKPECCDVVPVLCESTFDTHTIEFTLGMLKEEGSKAAPGFMNPEGIIIYHTAGNLYFKKTIDKDEQPKGAADA
jgi:hypothetical protein